jgi:hypothetical protein
MQPYRLGALAVLAVVAACSAPSPTDSTLGETKEDPIKSPPPSGSFGHSDGGSSESVPTSCAAPGKPPGDDVSIAKAFAGDYRVFDLGSIPGVPDPLGGCVVAATDANTLLVAGRSEKPDGALYSIKVKRDACKHIVGFEGTASKVIDAPYIDANLILGPKDTLVYAMWNSEDDNYLWPGKLAQKTALAQSAAVIAEVKMLGKTDDQGPGGIGFVPPGLAAAGQLRGLSQPIGNVLHIGYEKTDDGIRVTSVEKKSTALEGWPGGFAYVPAGSPGFPKQSMIVAEWSGGVVSTYEVDDQGDPIVSTRKLFFDKFASPWGAYFDAVTGDYLFLTWGGTPDRIFAVQGFAVPPPAPR